MLTTAPSVSVAEGIVSHLLEARLAACVTVLPGAVSHYRWEGKLEQAEEVQLLIKTTSARLQALELALEEVHPYDVPELLVLEVSGGRADYLKWIRAEVTP